MTKSFLNTRVKNGQQSIHFPVSESNQYPQPNRTTFNKILTREDENLRRRMSRLQDKACAPPSTKEIQNSKHRNRISEQVT